MEGGHATSAGAASSKSYWRNSKTESIHIALNNEFFTKKGLISLHDRWVAIRYG